MKPHVIAAAWGPAVTAVLLLASFPVRDRLPEPMATHWSGSVPDGSNSFTGHLVTITIIWAGTWLLLLAVSARGQGRRVHRMVSRGSLFGAGALMLAANASTLAANLDAADWRAAVQPGWHLPAVLATMVATGLLAGYLGRGAPDRPAPESQSPPRLRLKPGQRTVWISRTGNPWLSAVALVSFAAVAGVAVPTFLGVIPEGVAAAVLPGLVLVLALSLVTMSVTVRAGDDAVRLAFGALGWPARRILLSRIDAAWAEERRPGEVGGWGFRGVPGSATIMLRGGECLVLRYRSGGRLAISIDDAERGASLINALIAERVES
ncbi:hypothetical protein [Nonomuraea sp. NPDC050643]|uniref:hypothetical protein n=1 Tax=Nonomuraea sp. NPDC050643 TaxID=3155660 RepID=UPI0033C0C7D9